MGEMTLSVAALETCIVGWADETQDGAEIPAARAELAALVEAAGRVGALAAALAHYAARPTWRDYIVFNGERVECCTGTVYHPDKGAECPAPGWEVADAALADAGGGAAGARDEITDLAVAFVRACDGADTTADDPETDVADVDVAMAGYIGALDALVAAVHRLDALRADGATGPDEATVKARAWDDLAAIAGGRHPRELCPPRLRPLLAALVAECEARAGGAGEPGTEG